MTFGHVALILVLMIPGNPIIKKGEIDTLEHCLAAATDFLSAPFDKDMLEHGVVSKGATCVVTPSTGEQVD